MKIRCDYCDQEDAVVFCSADEAALCLNCDNRVHRANKVSQKHHRFSLVHPDSSNDSPLCDICQERRAMLFCQQDRAILCRECDYPIHCANEMTQKHSRFLLTGVKLEPLTGEESGSGQTKRRKRVDSANKVFEQLDYGGEGTAFWEDRNTSCGSSSMSTTGNNTNISEYLQTLPGWHVEEFFDHLQDPYYGFNNA